MKNILTILSEAGIEVTEEQKSVINKDVLANYKTIVDYDNATKKRDEYKQSLEDVQGKLELFKDVNIDELKGQINTLTTELQAEKDARVADISKNELEKNVEKFLTDKTFVNDITRNEIQRKLMEELDKDTAKGKSITDIFGAMTTDAEGKEIPNILVSKAETNKATFTTPASKTTTEGKVTPSDLMKMKNENPNLDISQYI